MATNKIQTFNYQDQHKITNYEIQDLTNDSVRLVNYYYEGKDINDNPMIVILEEVNKPKKILQYNYVYYTN